MNALITKFKKLYSGVVYDTLRFDLNLDSPFVLNKNIKRSWLFNDVLFGPAFTCQGEKVSDCQHINDEIRIKMFQDFYPGCVQVIASGGYREVAQFGDISGKIAQKYGALGVVLDAPTRDIKLIEQDQFKIFSMGIQPIDAFGKWQIIDFEVPVILPGVEGNVKINPGDFIFGDSDGVLVIPRNIVNECLCYAEKRLLQENKIRQEILNCNDIQEVYNNLGRW